MKKTIKIYKIPIIVTGLMLIGLIFWTAQQTKTEAYDRNERISRDAKRFFTAIESSLYVFGYGNNFDKQKFKFMIRYIIKNSPLKFVIINKNKTNFIKIGRIPRKLDLSVNSIEGCKTLENYSIYWKMHKLTNINSQYNNDGNLSTEDSKLSIIIGLKYHNILHRKGPPHRETVMLITLTVALLFIIIIFVAWVTLIRSRMLSVELQKQRLNTQYLEELGLAAAGLAHETKNPLGIILGLAQQIENSPNISHESRIKLEQIIDEVDTATARLGNFMMYAKHCELTKDKMDIKLFLSKVIDIIKPDFDSLNVKLILSTDSRVIFADEDKFRQILVNLLLNSLHASKSENTVTVRTVEDNGFITLLVKDNGSGISPELLPKIFKPYVAGSPGGHGLGLSITKRFIDLHGWKIEIKSTVNRGTTVIISGIEQAKNQE